MKKKKKIDKEKVEDIVVWIMCILFSIAIIMGYLYIGLNFWRIWE